MLKKKSSQNVRICHFQRLNIIRTHENSYRKNISHKMRNPNFHFDNDFTTVLRKYNAHAQ